MHKVDSFGTTPSHEFTNGDVSTPRTVLEAKWMNAVQRELVALVERRGGVLSDTVDDQLTESVVFRTADITGLRAFPVAGVNRVMTAIVTTGATGFVQVFTWNNASTATDDGATVVRPATNPAAGRWLVNNIQASTAPDQADGNNSSNAANTKFVQRAIALLVASSPAALDTLNELAAALGNDANFATTVTNALAAKAPLASPALTGTPTAPSASAGTNSTQIATTAFVQGAIAALIASAPGALDTLNELAAALGNDANFATTMANALALRARWTNSGFNTPTMTLSNVDPPSPGTPGRIWAKY
jgi:HPt (histidine-containing phosphotransfer) domain-containing protein